jgi:polysaccharide export outer membrane protein
MLRKRLLGPLLLGVAAVTFIAEAGAQQTSQSGAAVKDLVNYVQEARKLGLKDNDLRQNAIAAGWKPEQIDQAMKPAHAEPAPPGGPSPTPAAAPDVTEPRPNRGVADEYQIGSGDILQIQVWKEPEASVQSVVVRADGKIAVPFVKELTVSGLTPGQAEQLITTRLKPFYQDPEVSVIVREVHSKKIYLVGALKRPGILDMKYPMTVLQAVTEAGGLTDFAKRKKIYVLRTENGKEFRFPFNYDSVLRGEMMEQNIWIMPNDMIVVPQ